MNIIDKIKAEVQSLLTDSRGSHDWEHTERVFRLALHIGKKEGADMTIISLAALLHDIGRNCEAESHGRVCHAEKGAEMAACILEKHNLDSNLIKEIIHCIETHRFRNNKHPQTREAEVLFDADKLDSIGAVGIGRAFLFAGEVGAKLHNKNINIALTHSYSKEDTAYREYMVKLRHVKERMCTDEGKHLAYERHKFMEEFFHRLNKEVDGII